MDECKPMALIRGDVIRSSTVINNKVTEKINTYNCLGCTVAWQRKWTEKPTKSLQMKAIINQVLKTSPSPEGN